MRRGLGGLCLLALVLAPQVRATVQHDVRVVVVAPAGSGDREELRRVLPVLTESLPAQTRAGLWIWGASLSAGVGYGAVDAGWRAAAAGLATDPAPGEGRASLLRVIERLAWDLDVGRDARREILVVYTGALRDEADESARRTIAQDWVPRLQRAGFRVHGLGNASLPFLSHLVRATGGHEGRLGSASELRAFVERIVADGSADVADGSFVVEPERDEVTVVARIGAERSRLVSPAGQAIDSTTTTRFVRWHQAEDRLLVTLVAPAPGRWRLEPAPQALRVYDALGVHVRPRVDADRVVALSARLTQDGRLVDDPLLSGLVTCAGTWLRADGERSMRIRFPEGSAQEFGLDLDGVDYGADDRVRVVALARTFEREAEFAFTGAAPVRIAVEGAARGETLVDVRLGIPELAPADISVVGSILLPSGHLKLVAAVPGASGRWLLRPPRLAGDVEMTLKVSGNTLNRKEFSLTTEPIAIRLPLTVPVVAEFGLDGRRLGGAPVVDGANGVPPVDDAIAPSVSAASGAAAPDARPDAGAEDTATTDAPTPRPFTSWDAVGAGALVGLNLLVVLGVVARRLLGGRAQPEPAAVDALRGAVADYRSALTRAQTLLGGAA